MTIEKVFEKGKPFVPSFRDMFTGYRFKIYNDNMYRSRNQYATFFWGGPESNYSDTIYYHLVIESDKVREVIATIHANAHVGGNYYNLFERSKFNLVCGFPEDYIPQVTQHCRLCFPSKVASPDVSAQKGSGLDENSKTTENASSMNAESKLDQATSQDLGGSIPGASNSKPTQDSSMAHEQKSPHDASGPADGQASKSPALDQFAEHSDNGSGPDGVGLRGEMAPIESGFAMVSLQDHAHSKVELGVDSPGVAVESSATNDASEAVNKNRAAIDTPKIPEQSVSGGMCVASTKDAHVPCVDDSCTRIRSIIMSIVPRSR